MKNIMLVTVFAASLFAQRGCGMNKDLKQASGQQQSKTIVHYIRVFEDYEEKNQLKVLGGTEESIKPVVEHYIKNYIGRRWVGKYRVTMKNDAIIEWRERSHFQFVTETSHTRHKRLNTEILYKFKKKQS